MGLGSYKPSMSTMAMHAYFTCIFIHNSIEAVPQFSLTCRHSYVEQNRQLCNPYYATTMQEVAAHNVTKSRSLQMDLYEAFYLLQLQLYMQVSKLTDRFFPGSISGSIL